MLSLWLSTSSRDLRKGKEIFFYLHESIPFSTSVYQSDYLRNTVLLTHLVGTLVKEDNTGKFVPYIASEIKTSIDKKEWRFKISPGLSCENREKITAKSYSHNLTQSLKRYKKRGGRLLEFEKLKGSPQLSDFNASAIDGIYHENDWLVLKFEYPPEQLLERLTDQYFGYFCDGNFLDDNYTWKNDLSIISSGPYKIKHVKSANHFTLELREDFPLGLNSQVRRAHFITVDDLSEIKDDANIVQLKNVYPEREDLVLVPGRPTFTVNLSIETGKNNIFSDLSVRKSFFDQFYIQKNSLPYQSFGTVPANNIFPTLEQDYFKNLILGRKGNISGFSERKKAILAMSSSITGAERDYLVDIVRKVADLHNVSIEDYNLEAHGPDSLAERPWDLRITSVDLSSRPYFSHLDMIFCSQLGARYPDPSGKMCEFINENLLESTRPLNNQEISFFYSLLVEDASLIPISHRSITYLYSKNIDLDSVSGSALWPRVDLLEFINEK
jgi:hypothetical protein